MRTLINLKRKCSLRFNSVTSYQDYISYVLVSVGLVSLSVRLINTLGSGEIMCVIIGN